MGTEARHCKPIPAGDADLGAEGFGKRANPFYQRLVARRDQRGAYGDAAFCDGRLPEFLANVTVEPETGETGYGSEARGRAERTSAFQCNRARIFLFSQP